jgi:hypothetical protein
VWRKQGKLAAFAGRAITSSLEGGPIMIAEKRETIARDHGLALRTAGA